MGKGKMKVYMHIRMDNFKPFYVGITSTKRRATNRSTRNADWKAIVAKTDYVVVILMKGVDEATAIKKEIELVAKYGNIYDNTGILANRTKGGDYWDFTPTEFKSAKHKTLWQDKNFREKVIAKCTLARNQDEYKQGASDRMKQRWLDGDERLIVTGEAKERRTKAIRKALNTPEIRELRRVNATGTNSSQYDWTLRVFKHKKGCVFVGTKYELQKTYNLSSGFHRLLKVPNSTWGGWKLIGSIAEGDIKALKTKGI